MTKEKLYLFPYRPSIGSNDDGLLRQYRRPQFWKSISNLFHYSNLTIANVKLIIYSTRESMKHA